MKQNINQLIFSRIAPQKKLKAIEKLTSSELWATPEIITRIVKETGERIGKSRNKRLYISRDRQQGNNWNSTVVAVVLYKGTLYLDIYFQMDSTDTNLSVPFLHSSQKENIEANTLLQTDMVMKSLIISDMMKMTRRWYSKASFLNTFTPSTNQN